MDEKQKDRKIYRFIPEIRYPREIQGRNRKQLLENYFKNNTF